MVIDGMEAPTHAKVRQLIGIAPQDRMSDPKKTRRSIRESIAGIKASPKHNPEEAKLATFLQAFDRYLGSVDGETFNGQMKMEGPKIEAVKYAGGKRPRTSFEVSFPQSVVSPKWRCPAVCS